MADNVLITAGTDTTVATDNIAGVNHQRVKLSLGADGTASDAVAGSGVDGVGVQRVSLATDVALPAGANAIGKLAANAGVNIGDVRPTGTGYETVAASQTAQVMGGSGAAGDYIAGILVIPATVSPGAIALLDNATSIPVFAGGTNSLLTLHPFFIPLGMLSVSGAWKITTGANVSCIGIGTFT